MVEVLKCHTFSWKTWDKTLLLFEHFPGETTNTSSYHTSEKGGVIVPSPTWGANEFAAYRAWMKSMKDHLHTG